MADGNEYDPRLVSFREHTATKEEIIARVAKVELEQAEMKASLMHLPSKFDDFAQEMRARLDRIAASAAHQSAPQMDQVSLAMHHLADRLKGGGGINSALLAFALVGAVVLGAGVVFVLLKVG